MLVFSQREVNVLMGKSRQSNIKIMYHVNIYVTKNTYMLIIFNMIRKLPYQRILTIRKYQF